MLTTRLAAVGQMVNSNCLFTTSFALRSFMAMASGYLENWTGTSLCGCIAMLVPIQRGQNLAGSLSVWADRVGMALADVLAQATDAFGASGGMQSKPVAYSNRLSLLTTHWSIGGNSGI